MSILPPLGSQALDQQRSAISWRSIALGFFGVVLICGLTPYNDYALNNTFLVGNNLPIGVVMLLFLFILLVNGPLNRWFPRQALSAGEITVAFAMTLVSCALPSSGLMRQFPGTLISPYWLARGNDDYRKLLESMDLPRWLFPSFRGETVQERMDDPIVYGYVLRWTEDAPYPLLAWVQPLLTWGVFLLALYGALLCMVAIVRRQWVENERLPFPLAQIYLSLVEQPGRGRMFNSVLSRRSFWVPFAVVFVLHAWNGLHLYHPQYFPRVPVYYHLPELFTEAPWDYVDFKLTDAAVFFTVVGVTFFLSSTVAFSLWFFFILHNVHRIWLGMTTGDPHVHGMFDQHTGGLIAFALLVLWVGRGHWRLVLAQAFRGRREGEAAGRYLSYPVAFWGLVGCTGVMIVWLVAAGATVMGALVTVVLLLLGFFLITRIVAETGLVHGQLYLPLFKPWQLAATYGWQHPVPLKTFYLTGLVEGQHFDFREPAPVYASHGIWVADETIHRGREEDRAAPGRDSTGWKLILLLGLALMVGYVVSLGSMLLTSYSHAATRDAAGAAPINEWGTEISPQWKFLDPSVQYDQSSYHPQHSPAGNMAFGFVFTGAMGVLRLCFTGWPLHPIGFLMIGTFPGSHLWFSIMIGWLCKVLIVRLGGSKLYLEARPFFIGLIVGESFAAGSWLIMGIVLSVWGVPYHPVRIMPG